MRNTQSVYPQIYRQPQITFDSNSLIENARIKGITSQSYFLTTLAKGIKRRNLYLSPSSLFLNIAPSMTNAEGQLLFTVQPLEAGGTARYQ
jgi:hypothetical protein